jgi:hypothetical protein
VAVETSERRLQSIREQLAPPWTEKEERVVETGAIPILVRKRGRWYHLGDGGAAISHARATGDAPRNWLEVAERIVAEEGFNVNRSGVVFVDAVDHAEFAEKVAPVVLRLSECAQAVQFALLDAA